MAIDYRLELIRQSPINYNGLIIYQMSFGDICDEIGLKLFDELLFPFTLTKSCLKISDEEKEKLSLFEDFIIKDPKLLLSVSTALQYFCKCNEVSLYEKSLCLHFNDDKTFVINESNYNDICDILLKINGKNKIQIEEPPKNMSARQRDVWEKLNAGRRREDKKNTVHIYDVINICEFGGNYHIPIQEIEKWSIWKIKNCYKARIDMKTYDDSLKLCLVSGDGEKISNNNHWHHKLLVRD